MTDTNEYARFFKWQTPTVWLPPPTVMMERSVSAGLLLLLQVDITENGLVRRIQRIISAEQGP
jgi:hypothetical protein